MQTSLLVCIAAAARSCKAVLSLLAAALLRIIFQLAPSIRSPTAAINS